MHGQGSQEEITFCRDADAIIIPDGFKIMVPLGTEGVIMQELGGNYTVRVDTGYLVRVNALDADAIGKAVDPEHAGLVGEDFELDEERVYDILRSCYDPEIPVDIYELGLIYVIEVREANAIFVQMTLTSPMCPVAETLPPEVEDKVRSVSGVSGVELELVWDPPWSPDLMSEAARLQLNM